MGRILRRIWVYEGEDDEKLGPFDDRFQLTIRLFYYHNIVLQLNTTQINKKTLAQPLIKTKTTNNTYF